MILLLHPFIKGAIFMKKIKLILFSLLTFITLFTAISCGEENNHESTPGNNAQNTPPNADSPACDHELCRKETLDLSSIGACGGSITYQTCACGQSTLMSIEDFEQQYFENSECYFVNLPDRIYEIDEINFTQTESEKLKCTKCGLVLQGTTVINNDPKTCNYNRTVTLAFEMNDKKVGKTIIFHGTNDIYHDNEYVLTDMTEYTPCGGYVCVYKCTTCGDVSELKKKFNCTYGDSVIKTYTDEDGCEHTVITRACTFCTLVIEEDSWTYSTIICEKFDYVKTKILISGDLIFDATSGSGTNSHEIKTEYVLEEGKICTEGYTVKRSCEKCGLSVEYESFDHQREGYKSINLSEYGICGGYISGTACGICGAITSGLSEYTECNPGDAVVSEYSDENGNLHKATTVSCTECIFSIVTDEWTEASSACSYYENWCQKVFVGEKLIVDISSGNTYDQHDYEYVFKYDGEDCEDGFEVTVTCSKCDSIRKANTKSHLPCVDTLYELSNYGACGGSINVSVCPCGKESQIGYNYLCIFGNTSSTTYVDENGYTHTVYVSTCARCGLKEERDTYTVENGCKRISHQALTISVGNTVIIDRNNDVYDDSFAEHDEERFYVVFGDSCEDGFLAITTCKNCDYEYSNMYYYHHSLETTEYNFNDYGACGGNLLFSTCPCGEQASCLSFSINDCKFEHISETSYVDEDGYTHTVSVKTCTVCGMTVETDSVRLDNHTVVSYPLSVRINGNTVFANPKAR